MTKKQTKGPSLAEAAAYNEREGLRALRRRLCELIDSPDTKAYAIASLTRQLTVVLRRLDEMGEGAEHEPESKIEELQARRAARLASAASSRGGSSTEEAAS